MISSTGLTVFRTSRLASDPDAKDAAASTALSARSGAQGRFRNIAAAARTLGAALLVSFAAPSEARADQALRGIEEAFAAASRDVGYSYWVGPGPSLVFKYNSRGDPTKRDDINSIPLREIGKVRLGRGVKFVSRPCDGKYGNAFAIMLDCRDNRRCMRREYDGKVVRRSYINFYFCPSERGRAQRRAVTRGIEGFLRRNGIPYQYVEDR